MSLTPWPRPLTLEGKHELGADEGLWLWLRACFAYVDGCRLRIGQRFDLERYGRSIRDLKRAGLEPPI